MKRLILILLISVSTFSMNLTEGIIGAVTYTGICYSIYVPLAKTTPETFYLANNTRGLFDGLDRETHFVGGLGLYYWMRNNGNSKANSLLKTTLYSLAWEAKDGLKFMNYSAPWFHRTSVGNVFIHFAGDGFDIKDHYCVMLGAGTAIVFEYANELIFPNKKIKLIPFGIEARF